MRTDDSDLLIEISQVLVQIARILEIVRSQIKDNFVVGIEEIARQMRMRSDGHNLEEYNQELDIKIKRTYVFAEHHLQVKNGASFTCQHWFICLPRKRYVSTKLGLISWPAMLSSLLKMHQISQRRQRSTSCSLCKPIPMMKSYKRNIEYIRE